MIVFFLVIALLCLWGFGFRREADGDYLSRQQGDSVKGIFILMVFLFHANSYVQEAGYAYAHWTDAVFLDLCAKFGQLIVVMFLFFSGYGVMSAIRNKGAAYVQAMPRHRILTDTSVANNREIYYGGCLYPPEDRIEITDREYVSAVRSRLGGSE